MIEMRTVFDTTPDRVVDVTNWQQSFIPAIIVIKSDR
jgi:hypothetical protein